MAYTLENKERPYDTGSRYDALVEVLKNMQITDVGKVGDCLVLPGRLRKITDGERKTSSVIAKEDPTIRAIGKDHGMKFCCQSDRDAMTVTYWRVK